MANDVGGNPFIIDTATATAIYTDRFTLLAVQWTSASTANVCSLQDAVTGKVKWEAVSNNTNDTKNMAFPSTLDLIFNGLKVPTLDSGKVYLYIKRR